MFIRKDVLKLAILISGSLANFFWNSFFNIDLKAGNNIFIFIKSNYKSYKKMFTKIISEVIIIKEVIKSLDENLIHYYEIKYLTTFDIFSNQVS